MLIAKQVSAHLVEMGEKEEEIARLRKQLAAKERKIENRDADIVALNRQLRHEKQTANQIVEEGARNARVLDLEERAATATARARDEVRTAKRDATKVIHAERAVSHERIASANRKHAGAIVLERKFAQHELDQEKSRSVKVRSKLDQSNELAAQLQRQLSDKKRKLDELETNAATKQREVKRRIMGGISKKLEDMKTAHRAKIDEKVAKVNQLIDASMTMQRSLRASDLKSSKTVELSEKRRLKLKHSAATVIDLRVKLEESLDAAKTNSDTIAEQARTIRTLQDDIAWLHQELDSVEQRQLRKVPRKSTGGLTWPNWVMSMIIELLACRTPPSCIAPVTMIVPSYIVPGEYTMAFSNKKIDVFLPVCLSVVLFRLQVCRRGSVHFVNS